MAWKILCLLSNKGNAFVVFVFFILEIDSAAFTVFASFVYCFSTLFANALIKNNRINYSNTAKFFAILKKFILCARMHSSRIYIFFAHSFIIRHSFCDEIIDYSSHIPFCIISRILRSSSISYDNMNQRHCTPYVSLRFRWHGMLFTYTQFQLYAPKLHHFFFSSHSLNSCSFSIIKSCQFEFATT